jgi:tRNA dimethylallyltransferase
LYLASVTEGYVMSDIEPDLEYRAYLETLETPKLYEMLSAVQPDTEVDPRNRNRVMRLLEKIHDGDNLKTENQPRYDCLKLGCTFDRSVVRDRIDERLKMRVDMGMIEEVQRLLDEGATVDFMIRLGLEYRFVTQYLIGEIPDKDEMLALLATAIKQFAKRQMIWFRRDKDIQWLNMTADPKTEAIGLIDNFLKN